MGRERGRRVENSGEDGGRNLNASFTPTLQNFSILPPKRSYEAASTETSSGPQKSIEGWILIVANIHEEASEEDIEDPFSDHGYVQHMTVNRDRRTGRIKSALVEYAEKVREGRRAKRAMKRARMSDDERANPNLLPSFRVKHKRPSTTLTDRNC